MPIPLTNNDVFTDPVMGIANGDPVDAATDNLALQALVNRTTNLKNRVVALESWRVTDLADADADLSVGVADVYLYGASTNLTAPGRTLTVRHTGDGNVPTKGDRIRVHRYNSSANYLSIVDEAAVVLIKFLHGIASCELEYDGTAWKVALWCDRSAGADIAWA
ncbi:MAG: hypothetical protein IT373_11935 [Polyangiaceae bacterium]|nr:hypothetical protein [Polyangiaceae bacterium]